jgi:hypothetical protein
MSTTPLTSDNMALQVNYFSGELVGFTSIGQIK